MVYMDEVGLGKRLQEARQRAGFTQQQLCATAGLSYSTLAKIERGAIKSPSIFTIQSIADTLGLSLDELLGHEVKGAVRPNENTGHNGIKFVYFDINGCLVRFFHHAFTKLANDTGASSDAVESTYWHFNDAVCRGEMTMTDFNAALASALGVTSVDWTAYYLEAVQPIIDMQDMVLKVSERYQVGLLSNIMPGQIDAMLKNGMLPNIDYKAIVDSSEVMAIKPEQRIYEVAAGLAAVPPAQILLVDDSRPNLMAAEKMGWKVLWFDDYRIEDSLERIQSMLR
jgi:FMN phosphatase YigB (HAD superfamily)/DNA-binding XRE family transcriptional regulator